MRSTKSVFTWQRTRSHAVPSIMTSACRQLSLQDWALISPVMLRAGLEINKSVPKELGGRKTPLQLGRCPFLGLGAPIEPAAAPLLQLETSQQVLQETGWASLHRTSHNNPGSFPASGQPWVSLTESSSGCKVPVSACGFSMMLLPSKLTEQHIVVFLLPGSLFFGVICQPDISPHAATSSLTS